MGVIIIIKVRDLAQFKEIRIEDEGSKTENKLVIIFTY